MSDDRSVTDSAAHDRIGPISTVRVLGAIALILALPRVARLGWRHRRRRPPPAPDDCLARKGVANSQRRQTAARPLEGRSSHTAALRSALASAAISVNGHLFLPNYGHLFSPTAAMVSPHWWPSFLPTTWVRLGVSGQRLHPLAGGRLCESIAVLALGDQDVGVMQEPVDGRGRDALGHQLVER